MSCSSTSVQPGAHLADFPACGIAIPFPSNGGLVNATNPFHSQMQYLYELRILIRRWQSCADRLGPI